MSIASCLGYKHLMWITDIYRGGVSQLNDGGYSSIGDWRCHIHSLKDAYSTLIKSLIPPIKPPKKPFKSLDFNLFQLTPKLSHKPDFSWIKSSIKLIMHFKILIEFLSIQICIS